MKRALENVKVLDFSWVAAGPLVTKYMADHGALVVRIESSTRPDTMRTTPPYKDRVPGINRSGHYAFWNTNKYSMALNMKHPEARGIVKKLVAWADVVCENFLPGQMERWGLGYEDLRRIKSDIIFLRTSMFGQTGPLATHSGFGPFLAGAVGFQNITGWPDRGPVVVGGITDHLSPDYALAVLIAALDYRDKTNEGQCIDISQCEVSLLTLAPLILEYFANGEEGKRRGNRCPYAAPHGVYRCKGDDSWCAIAVFSDKEWSDFCHIIGSPQLITDSRFATLLARKKHEEELDKLVESWTSNLPAHEVMTKLQTSGIAAGQVLTGEGLLSDPQNKARERFWLMEHPEIGPYYHLGKPFQLWKTPAEGRIPAPLLGQHTELVCREILGMSDQEFITLLQKGLFE